MHAAHALVPQDRRHRPLQRDQVDPTFPEVDVAAADVRLRHLDDERTGLGIRDGALAQLERDAWSGERGERSLFGHARCRLRGSGRRF
jgi:hypothetical protein